MGCNSSKQAMNAQNSFPAEIDISKGMNADNENDILSYKTDCTTPNVPFRMDKLSDISKQFKKTGSVSEQFTKRKSITSQTGSSKRRSSFAEKRESIRKKRLINEIEYYW
mmetsp:Transcript_1946/g.2861  ORF Transcript_1946/g.2861 Transcript_1946/m.2861 type:complete len:110 (+) Transcript_1946:17-346(+)